MRPMSRERFLHDVDGQGWGRVETYLQCLDADDGYWSDEFLANAVEAAKLAHVRRQIKNIKTDDGVPIFGSTTETGEDGQEYPIYKQEALFDEGDYAHLVEYHGSRAKYHLNMAYGYQERARARFGVQIPMPLEGMAQS